MLTYARLQLAQSILQVRFQALDVIQQTSNVALHRLESLEDIGLGLVRAFKEDEKTLEKYNRKDRLL